MRKSSRSLLADLLREDVGETVGSLDDLFVEEPVDLSCFVQDKKFLNNPPLSPVQYEFVRHFEQIYLPETYPLLVEEFGEHWLPVRWVNDLSAEWGKGSGKDHCCRIALARVVYLLLCLSSPQKYFGKPPQDEIHILNMATTAPQAHTVFFKPFRTVMTKSPWFKDKFSEGLPSPAATSIRFVKQIEAISGHSLAESHEGLNLIAAIADEISAFKTAEETQQHGRGGRESPKTAQAILQMLRTSARTRFPINFKVAAISYPRFKGDPIEQLIFNGREDIARKGEQSRIYVSGPLPTWAVNPLVSEEVIKNDELYETDPASARAKYECLPELSANRFFHNDVVLHETFQDEPTQEPVTIEYYWGVDELEAEAINAPKPLPGWQVRFRFASDFYPMLGAQYALHGDMAVTGDKAGVAMCHVRTWEKRDWQTGEVSFVMEARPVVRVDFVTSFAANKATRSPDGTLVPREVQVRWYRKLVWELMTRGFNVRLATFDQFQSTDSIQILNSRGVESKRVSTVSNNLAYMTLRDVMYDGRLEAYRRDSLILELGQLTQLPNGKIDHPPSGSKDEADALAGAVLGSVELGGDEGDEPERADLDFTDFFDIKSVGGSSEVRDGWSAPAGDQDLLMDAFNGAPGGW